MQIKDFVDFARLPQRTVHLMLDKTAENDPFYAQVVQNFYKDANTKHPKWRVVKNFACFSLCELPADFDTYFMKVEASARRNYKKAMRLGYQMKRFDYNTHLEAVRSIWQSTPVRQGGLLPEDIREGQVRPIADPPSLTPYHGYPYFGIFKDDKLAAYAGCLIAGELCNLNDIYGHADYLADGVVPLLIIEIYREIRASYPGVRYYGYGTYFGASETMRRFKRKFLFNPHRVTWALNSKVLIYRLDISAPFSETPSSPGSFVLVRSIMGIFKNIRTWLRNWGWRETLKASLKILSRKRVFFGVVHQKDVVQSGWANLGFCRHYPVERNAVVIGDVWTSPEWRGQGLASAAMRQVIAELSRKGYHRFYADTQVVNKASQRMIEKVGFKNAYDYSSL